MRKALVGTLLIAVAAVGCSDSIVDPQDDGSNFTNMISFNAITQDFTYPASVVDSDQGNRMFIPDVGFTNVMDGGAFNDGTSAGEEPDRSDPTAVLSPFDDEWFSLGLNVGEEGALPGEGFVVVDFGTGVTGRAAVVFEQTFNTESYPDETATVEGSNDLSTWVTLGTVGNKGADDDDCGESCSYQVLAPADACYQYVRVTNTTTAAGYNALSYVTDGKVNAAPGASGYPGNDLIPDGFDVQAIAFESVCEPETGCTSTQGYWRTHNDSFRGGAPTDETWDLLGADAEETGFFDSGETYFDVLWASVAGNKAYILAQQYIAAELNLLAGATMPSDVQDAFDAATDWFTTNATGDEFPVVKGADGEMLTEWSEILTAYNEGDLGPGSCDDLEGEGS